MDYLDSTKEAGWLMLLGALIIGGIILQWAARRVDPVRSR